MKTFVLLSMLMMCSLLSFETHAQISNIPNVLTAPIVFYDEGGNPLEDGSYVVTVSLQDHEGNILYDEEQQIDVVNHVASLLIGQGYVVGSSFGSPTGGLSREVFDVEGDISVEISVSGVQQASESLILSSQPFAFISEYALTVADSSITTHSIKDGTITEEDLNETFLEELRSTQAVNGEGDAITANSIQMASGTNLANSGSSTVQGVLQDLDQSINAVKALDVASLSSDVDVLTTGLADVEVTLIDVASSLSNHTSSTGNPHGVTYSQVGAASATHDHDGRYLELDGTAIMIGNLDLGGQNITNVGTVDGVDVAAIANDVDDTQEDVSAIQSFTPIAFGRMYDTGSGDGQTMWCEGGRNMTQSQNNSRAEGLCKLSEPAGSGNYRVVWSIETSGCASPLMTACEIFSKTTGQFYYRCECLGSAPGTVSGFEASFVVYE